MVMFDSLNRHMLPPFGCDWVHAPNFKRLAEQTVTFDQSYVCSMPCMPARRDLHTGRPNFLHRSWGPLEPFDDSVPEILKKAGVYTHLCTDHYHYFETGGANYHTRYNTWEFFRGHEGEPWFGQVAPSEHPEAIGRHGNTNPSFPMPWIQQDWKNRGAMPSEGDHSQSKTFRAGIEFIERNRKEDNWWLQIETFDPHEPYFSARQYKHHYAEHYDRYTGPHFDWPNYGKVEETPEQIEHLRHENASLISMCDAKLGDVLDTMDRLKMWEDTMLIVWTDHGFLLGEHDGTGKCWCPFYQEIAHTPFFIWDPRCRKRGERRQALIQPSIDLGPTLLDFFGVEATPDMLGPSLSQAIADDTPIREAAIFGMHGAHVNVTDGRYVYMRGPVGEANGPLFEYTLMPAHMRDLFSMEELREKISLQPPFGFTKDCATMKIDRHPGIGGGKWTGSKLTTRLYDVSQDPGEERPLEDEAVEARMREHLLTLMNSCEAPPEQYARLGLNEPAQ